MNAFPARDDDPGVEPELAEALLREAAPIVPPDPVRQRLRDRVLAAARPTGHLVESADFLTVFGATGGWTAVNDKVDMRVMRKEGNVLTVLYRMRPGGEIPPHRHPGDEESYVLEGTVDIGPLHCVAGDFHVARAGSEHPPVTSATGSLFLSRHIGGLPLPL